MEKPERIAGTGITVSSEAEVLLSKKTGNGNLPLLTVAMPMTVCHEGASWGRESLCSHAAQEMREGPSVSACRRRHQTHPLLLHLRDVVVSEMGKGRT